MSRRVSIEVPGFGHDNPIPAACRIGSLLISSAISGKEPYTGKLPDTIEAQCEHMWNTVRSVLEIAGGSPADVIKMTVWLKDRSQRKPVNDEWLKMFPDEHSRPARHALPMSGDGPALVQCDFTAVIGG